MLTIHRLTPGDGRVADWLDVRNTAYPWRLMTAADLERYTAASPRRATVLAELDGRPAGAAWANARALDPASTNAPAGVLVLPEARRRGVGTALYRELSREVSSWGIDTLSVLTHEADPAGREYAERRGYAEVARMRFVELDVAAAEARAVTLPPGVEIVTLAERPELLRGVYEVDVEATPDMPGRAESAGTYEQWHSLMVENASFSPKAWFVAVADGTPVGFALLELLDGEPGKAFHEMTGVRRAWRRRGIAGALKGAQIAWAKEHGLRTLETMNEERNEPIRRLNARLGYRPQPDRIQLDGPLA